MTKYPYIDPTQIHSIGIKPHPHGHAIAKSLLNIAGYKSHAGPLAPPLEVDDRPLIDRLHEATFTEAPGLQWYKDKYALRTIIRKEHCFTLDDATSSLVADFSVAIAQDLEATRQMAIPPFPVTWIDLNNHKRINRIKELGIPLTPAAAGETDAGPPVERVGWLIHPANDLDGYYAHYVCVVESGVMAAPLAYFWHTGKSKVSIKSDKTTEYFQWITFGVKDGNVNSTDAFPSTTPMHNEIKRYPKFVGEMMQEIAGELRHIWGTLVAIGAGHLGAQTSYDTQPLPTRAPPVMKNGKPLLPLEHKVLHLHLNKKSTPQKLIAKAITNHHNRRHDVRAHWRQLKNGKRVSVKSHQRGDERLGQIEKTYKVER